MHNLLRKIWGIAKNIYGETKHTCYKMYGYFNFQLSTYTYINPKWIIIHFKLYIDLLRGKTSILLLED